MSNIDYKAIAEKWSKKWDEDGIYTTDTESAKEKVYLLVEFPYPSGEGLHVGHVRSYTAMDVIARKKRAEGYEVLFPIGYDAFGLPAENYAIKTGIHPSITVRKNIDNFERQMKGCGFSFDWSRRFETTDPSYYKWTQWIFLQMYNKDLAYKKVMPVNWCPKDKCVLANEEVIDGACERCGTKAEKKNKEQWMLAITKYAERLYKDLDETEYLDKIKIQQRNWIGLSQGAEIDFGIRADGYEGTFTVFTTRADTLYGCTYCVLAPEHPLVEGLILKGSITNVDQVNSYIEETRQKSDIDRNAEGREKTGVQLMGVMAINPVNEEKVPVFIADYVLPQYGTGAIMAVPAHDERDGEFADKYGIHKKLVINVNGSGLVGDIPKDFSGDIKDFVYSKLMAFDGILMNSGEFNGLTSEEARAKITEKVGGKIVVKSKLRDWVFARQRYWGEPIPVVYDKDKKMYPVAESELPVVLPMVDKYEPTDSGESPLALLRDWVEVKGVINEDGCFVRDESGEVFYRETDTMPQWAGSSWYFMRYIDPHNNEVIGDKEMLAKWLPVSWYNGGMEHTTLHLLYSRFWYKFLHDIGVVPNNEPYHKRTSQGMILGAGGVKMSKSIGNVVNPDTVITEYGADVLRIYEMFIAPFDQSVAWDDKAIVGVSRFLDKVAKCKDKVTDESSTLPIIHQTIQKVTRDIDATAFNTAISSLMICVNELEKQEKILRSDYESLLQILAPFAPFITEELWSVLGNETSIHTISWPKEDARFLVNLQVTYAVQINGKLKGTFTFETNSEEKMVIDYLKTHEIYQKYVGGVMPKKIIFVKNRLVNIVI